MESDLELPKGRRAVQFDMKKHIPNDFQPLVHEILYHVLKEQPDNIVDYIAKYLNGKITARQAREASKLDLTADDL